MRNFWLQGRIDGRKSTIHGGPRNKAGGFKLNLYMKDEGRSVLACQLEGWLGADGKLHFQAYDQAGNVVCEHHADPKKTLQTKVENALQGKHR